MSHSIKSLWYSLLYSKGESPLPLLSIPYLPFVFAFVVISVPFEISR